MIQQQEHPIILEQQGCFSFKRKETKGIISLWIAALPAPVPRWDISNTRDTPGEPAQPALPFIPCLAAPHSQTPQTTNLWWPQPPGPSGHAGKGEKLPLPQEINGIINICLRVLGYGLGAAG